MTNCALTTHSELEGWVLSFSISDSYKKTEQLTYCELDFVTPNIQKKIKIRLLDKILNPSWYKQ